MAFTTTNQITHSFMDRIAALKDDAAARYAQYRVFRTTLNELQTLSSRELADLGMSRSSLKSVAYEAAYKN